MQFQDEMAAGIVLVRPALRSPDYASGATGWTVNQDGTAEFNDVVVRGTVRAQNAAGDYAELSPDAPSGVAETTAPGLLLSKASGDVTPAGLTEYDDTFTRGLYLRTSSPLAIETSGEGIDYAAMRMTGRFHGSDPSIILAAGDPADAPDGYVQINGTVFDASGGISVYGGGWQTFNPILSNTGGSTTSTKVGYYRLWGDEVEFVAYFVFSGAGSGATPLTFTGPPYEIDRSARQFVPAHMEAFAAGNSGFGGVVAFTSGSGNVWDRLRNLNNTTMTGADITATAIVTIKGRYRRLI